jgi:hypothetical protein
VQGNSSFMYLNTKNKSHDNLTVFCSSVRTFRALGPSHFSCTRNSIRINPPCHFIPHAQVHLGRPPPHPPLPPTTNTDKVHLYTLPPEAAVCTMQAPRLHQVCNCSYSRCLDAAKRLKRVIALLITFLLLKGVHKQRRKCSIA